jgi:UrcA family protein
MNRRISTLAVATTAAAALFATAAVASAQTVETHVVVNYADLDLSSPKGVDSLYARLKGAAVQACGKARDVMTRAYVKACRERALDGAVESVGHAALTAKHFGSEASRYARLERNARGS